MNGWSLGIISYLVDVHGPVASSAVVLRYVFVSFRRKERPGARART